MKNIWADIERKLSQLGCLDAMALRPGAGADDIAALERHLGTSLPEDLKHSLAIHDGQDSFGLAQGCELLSIAGIRQQWDNWRDLDEDDMNAELAEDMGSDPQDAIKPMYCNRAWIPLTHDGSGNHIGLDFDPGPNGQRGQVITFGRDEEIKRLIADGFESWLVSCSSWLDGAAWNGRYLDVKTVA